MRNRFASLPLNIRSGLIDSYSAFKTMKQDGTDLKSYMAQSNHPNEKGACGGLQVNHAMVCKYIASCSAMQKILRVSCKEWPTGSLQTLKGR